MKEYKTGVKPKYANEFFDAIVKAETPEKKTELLKQYGAMPPLNFLLAMNFDSTVQFELPSGMPPYNRDEATHEDLNAPLATCIRRIFNCLKSKTNIKKSQKEYIFIQLLEGIGPKEADILVACKDKALHEIYPDITPEFVKSVFPAYVK